MRGACQRPGCTGAATSGSGAPAGVQGLGAPVHIVGRLG